MNIHSHFSAGAVETEPFYFARELSMESWIVENKDILKFNPDTDDDVEILDWEMTIPNARRKKSGKKGDGRIDIIALYGKDVIAVIELKLGTADKDAKEQLCDYLSKKEEIINKLQENEDMENVFENKTSEDFTWMGILCAESISPEVLSDIESGNATCDELRAISIKRFLNKNSGQVYILTECYYKNEKTSRNKQKVRFNDDGEDGSLYFKGRAVFEAVKRYIAVNNPSYSDLLKVFPKDLQGSYGVIKQVKDIISSGQDGRFFKDELSLKDGKCIRVCSQWGVDGLKYFIGEVKKIGIEMELV